MSNNGLSGTVSDQLLHYIARFIKCGASIMSIHHLMTSLSLRESVIRISKDELRTFATTSLHVDGGGMVEGGYTII